jgi:hypothetical protein
LVTARQRGVARHRRVFDKLRAARFGNQDASA